MAASATERTTEMSGIRCPDSRPTAIGKSLGARSRAMGQSARKSVSVVIAAREPLRRSIYEALTERGHKVAESCTALEDTRAAVRRAHPDVCVVERELPGGRVAAT